MFADASGAISYQYDGWRFAEANVYTQHAMGPGLVDLETARIGGETYISKSSSLKIDLTAVIITKKKTTRNYSENYALSIPLTRCMYAQYYLNMISWVRLLSVDFQ